MARDISVEAEQRELARAHAQRALNDLYKETGGETRGLLNWIQPLAEHILILTTPTTPPTPKTGISDAA